MTYPRASLFAVAFPLLAAISACAAPPPSSGEPEPEVSPGVIVPAPALATRVRIHTDLASGLRFPLDRDLTVDAQRFDPSLPEDKLRFSIHLSAPEGPVAILDVWQNPGRLPLRAWFDAHLGFLAGERAELSERAVTRASVPAIVSTEARSPHATSRTTAVFLLGDRALRVTAIDPEGDRRARAALERILDGLEEVTP